jgi:hypothetical protein
MQSQSRFSLSSQSYHGITHHTYDTHMSPLFGNQDARTHEDSQNIIKFCSSSIDTQINTVSKQTHSNEHQFILYMEIKSCRHTNSVC